MPVKAGSPPLGSSRWCAGLPSGPGQQRRPMPLVAKAPSRTRSSWTGSPPNGSSTRTSRARPALPPMRRSPQQSTAYAGWLASSAASRSASRPLAMPPLSIATPGGRTTVPALSSAPTERQREEGCGPAAARRSRLASATSRGTGAPLPSDSRYPASSIASSSVASTRPPLLAPAIATAAASERSSGVAGTSVRGSRLSRLNSLSGSKRESRSWESSKKRRACSTAAAERASSPPCTWTLTVPPKQANERCASPLTTGWS